MDTITLDSDIYEKLRVSLIFRLDKDIDDILRKIGLQKKILKFRLTRDHIECIDIDGNKICFKRRDIFD